MGTTRHELVQPKQRIRADISQQRVAVLTLLDPRRDIAQSEKSQPPPDWQTGLLQRLCRVTAKPTPAQKPPSLAAPA